MLTFFELAPRSRRNDWDKALAFSIAPAVPTFAAIYFFAGGPVLATIVTAACFVGTFLCALTLASTPLGRIALTEDELRLDSGFLHTRIPLCELDLDAARAGDDTMASPRLVTAVSYAVLIPRRVGPPIVVTPLNRDAFISTLRTLSV